MGNHRKFVAIAVSAAIGLGCAAAAVVLTTSSAASAKAAEPQVGITHKLTLNGNHPDGFGDGLAIEGATQFDWSCNDSTGIYNMKLKGLSVIDTDHITPFDATIGPNAGYWVRVLITNPAATHSYSFYVNVKQNAKSGLFGVHTAGVIADIAACTTGSPVLVDTYDHAFTTFPYYNTGAES
jgi:hypothetical protein